MNFRVREGWIASRRCGMMSGQLPTMAMIRLERLSVYLPIPEVPWSELAVKVRFALARLIQWRISTGSVSDEWVRQHERDSGKH